jgi:hypothetical protein
MSQNFISTSMVRCGGGVDHARSTKWLVYCEVIYPTYPILAIYVPIGRTPRVKAHMNYKREDRS